MAQEIDLQIRFAAEDMYVEQRMTYQAIADRLEVAVNTVKRWGQDGAWKEKRKDYLEKRRALKQKLANLRDAMIDQAAESQDPQQAFAALRILKMEMEQERKTETKTPDIDRPKIFMEDLEFIAETLKEIDPAALKVFAKNFETIVEQFKKKHEKSGEQRA